VVVATRSGNTSKPDKGWSAWEKPAQPAKAGGGAQVGRVVSPPGRYLQYRVSWAGGREGVPPCLCLGDGSPRKSDRFGGACRAPAAGTGRRGGLPPRGSHTTVRTGRYTAVHAAHASLLCSWSRLTRPFSCSSLGVTA
jgi:hypothetical protein